MERVEFQAGPDPDSQGTSVGLEPVTILVGPNNSGKSLALREIEDWCNGVDQEERVIDSISAEFPSSEEEAEELMEPFLRTEDRGGQKNQTRLKSPSIGKSTPGFDKNVNMEGVLNAAENGQERLLRQYILSLYTVRLDGRTRFSLTDETSLGDLQGIPQNHLHALFVDDKSRQEARRIIHDAFGLYFVLDPTNPGKVRVRLSEEAPAGPKQEQSLDGESRSFHSSASPVQEMSDGVQAFVGLVSAALSLPHKVILVDEPEAFLAPPLARKLGANLARIAQNRGSNLITATHSPEFLKGCLESTSGVNVVRLTFEQETGVATSRILDPETLKRMVQQPLLRSTGVFSALFHRAAIVTEADTDRAFYDEINRRLLDEGRGIEDAIFLNAQNKDTVHRIIRPLRAAGIAAAGIVDLDVLKLSGKEWVRLLGACGFEEEEAKALEGVRANVLNQLENAPSAESGKPAMYEGGIQQLGPEDHETAENLLDRLSSRGLFVVPLGELESWLGNLGAHGKATDWLVSVFERLGRDPGSPAYQRPTKGDVWGFVDDVGMWVRSFSTQ